MSYENTGPIVQQPSSSDLSFIAGTGGVTAGQAVYLSSTGTVLPTTGPMQFVGIVKVGASAGKICTVTRNTAKARATAYGTVNAGDIVISGPNGTIQSLAAIAGNDLSGGTALAVNNANSRKAVCDTGASSGGTAVIIL
jgi:hypothetical protein